MTQNNKPERTVFDTGAFRDADVDKIDFEGHVALARGRSPLHARTPHPAGRQPPGSGQLEEGHQPRQLTSLRPDGLRARGLQGGGDPFGVVSMTIHRNLKRPFQLLMRLRHRRGLGIGAALASAPAGRVPAVFAPPTGWTKTSLRGTPQSWTTCSIASSASRRVSNSPMIVLSKPSLSELVAGNQPSDNPWGSYRLVRHARIAAGLKEPRNRCFVVAEHMPQAGSQDRP